jgi:hypothetical protein
MALTQVTLKGNEVRFSTLAVPSYLTSVTLKSTFDDARG